MKALSNIKDYTIKDLKHLCNIHHVKKSGKKLDIFNRLYEYIVKYNACICIQSVFRGYLQRQLWNIQNLKHYSRSINDEEFFSLEPISNIPLQNRICISDREEFTYCFDICSLKKLYERDKSIIQNPYTTKSFDDDVKQNMEKMEKLSYILNRKIVQTHQSDETHELTYDQKLSQDVMRSFQEIDSFGYITDINWILQLNRIQYMNFLLYFYDIWNYRADLSLSVRKKMFPPSGNPFHYCITECNNNINNLRMKTITFLKTHTIHLIKILMQVDTDRDHKGLSALYILSTITLIHVDAARTYPMLFESVRL